MGGVVSELWDMGAKDLEMERRVDRPTLSIRGTAMGSRKTGRNRLNGIE